MTYEEFTNSLTREEPPAGLAPLLLALWHDGKGNWEMSHNIAQDIETNDGAQIHAYLHRKEGDIWNADYWYRKAGVKRPSTSLEEEWEALVEQHLL